MQPQRGLFLSPEGGRRGRGDVTYQYYSSATPGGPFMKLPTTALVLSMLLQVHSG